MGARWWAVAASVEFALYLYTRNPGHHRPGDVLLWFTFGCVIMMLSSKRD